MSTVVITDRHRRPIGSTVAVILTILTVGYLLPWMIATMRGKANWLAILLLNIFLGWTLIGWIVVLVMACTSHQAVAVSREDGAGDGDVYREPAGEGTEA